ncbi:uncharacterized protein EV420DRAFT_1505414 [Desarmillaria tabescens]|uniref:B30.2/SPRY domain-containing protein n=1 Tax=Armillaria tabescens TaxID=1929756 RepID=A0AA39NJI9_ARMTA|nr:uncharacterized protein EV420DRAFT_1505414 [Desarmillaria tabescens]KAK0466795.1 hypothetical protein EV420DRAFT_1505414 [Desarmillaria tabescens]
MLAFLRNNRERSPRTYPSQAPPQWSAAPEVPYEYGLYNEAPGQEYDDAEDFCNKYPMQPPRILPSYLKFLLPGSRFSGTIYNIDAKPDSKAPAIVRIRTNKKFGFYYEILIHRMEGFLAIGTACQPYPAWRLPGWNRLSAGLHLDDFRKFFEDPAGGRDYTSALQRISPGDTIGCGFEFQTGSLFYTYNGIRLPNAFTGIYLPRQNYDVFAAIGVEGVCDFEVNFGGELVKWPEGNEWQWKLDGIIGRLGYPGSGNGLDEELPSYSRT